MFDVFVGRRRYRPAADAGHRSLRYDRRAVPLSFRISFYPTVPHELPDSGDLFVGDRDGLKPRRYTSEVPLGLRTGGGITNR